MTRATRDFVNNITGNFSRGYEQGTKFRRQKGEDDLASFSLEDHTSGGEPEEGAEGAIPTPDAAPAAPVAGGSALPTESAEAGMIGFAEGGDPEAVNALVAIEAEDGAIDADPQYGANPVDRTVIEQRDIPNVRVVDWEAAKRAKADAYARAGMPDKAANIDDEFNDLKQRKFQEYGSRALQMIASDPARAAKYLNMASQYSADGTAATYVPTPGGQLVEVEFDEMTGEALGPGTPIDEQAIRKLVLMNSDPQKFLYNQMDREYKAERARKEDEQFEKKYERGITEFIEKQKQWRAEMDYKYDELDVKKAVAEGRANAQAAKANGYSNEGWDDKVVSLNKYFDVIGDPMKFRNEFGKEYQLAFDDDGNPIMPDMMKLRTGAEAIMGGHLYNRTMSPQVATEIFLTTSDPARAAELKGRLNTDQRTGQPLIKGADGVWYYLPGKDKAAAPTPKE